ncbi:MAG: NAD(P)-binding protein [Myxococcota bacterium]
MQDGITRRDFLNGVAIGTGASLLSPAELFAAAASEGSASSYPPTSTGLRGNHPGAYEVMHDLAWRGQRPASYRALDEHYDLVIVGAGLSGLSAAYFYRERIGADAKILLLDNHDDFGGHAKRNEFHQDGRTLLGVGGSVNLEQPAKYSDVAQGLLRELGIDLEAMLTNIGGFDLLGGGGPTMLAMPGSGEGEHVAVTGEWSKLMLGIGDYASAIRSLPIVRKEQDKLIALFGGEVDFLEGLSATEKEVYVASTAYLDFLTERVGLSKETASIFFPVPKLIWGPGALRVSVLEAFYLGCPGVQGMPWLGELEEQIVAGITSDETSSLYFPDGNASLARLLVASLIPKVAPGAGFADIATRRFDYSVLDRGDHAVRLRLNSTVVGVEQTGEGRVTVDYVRGSEAVRVTGDRCILACYNGAIPFLCPELPESQKEALRYGVKVPLVLSNVVLHNGLAWSKLGTRTVNCPGDPYVVLTTAPPTTTGGHQPPQGPEDPMVVFLLGVPEVERTGDETGRDLCLQARHRMYATRFETYERQIRDQLQGVLGKHGFDHERDIQAITINRWAHGYAYEYMALDDPEWPEGKAPHELGRAQFGRISIANSDSEAYAYVNAAIDSAWRAVEEQTALSTAE